ncbi:aldo/keto reductase [Paenarthrobacter sp. RAF9]
MFTTSQSGLASILGDVLGAGIYALVGAGVTSAAGLSLAFAGDYLKPFLDPPPAPTTFGFPATGRFAERPRRQRVRSANQALVAHVIELAAAKDAVPAQIALAWLLAQQPWIVPIPGTRRTARIKENAEATRVALTADEVAALNALARNVGVHGDRYNATHMGYVNG